MKNETKNSRFAFFGSSNFSVTFLEGILEMGYTPSLIITQPPTEKGRGKQIEPTIIGSWAHTHKIPAIESNDMTLIQEKLQAEAWDYFLVASYGVILPESLINIPKHGTINIHPSFLPALRGATPVQTAIMNGLNETGVSIIKMVKKMDAGPIIAQKKVRLMGQPRYTELRETLAEVAAELFTESVAGYLDGTITPQAQDEASVTFTKKIEKETGRIPAEVAIGAATPEATRYERLVRALNPNPGCFTELVVNGRKMRIKITDAKVSGVSFVPVRVIPEGKKEMRWDDFVRGNKVAA